MLIDTNENAGEENLHQQLNEAIDAAEKEITRVEVAAQKEAKQIEQEAEQQEAEARKPEAVTDSLAETVDQDELFNEAIQIYTSEQVEEPSAKEEPSASQAEEAAEETGETAEEETIAANDTVEIEAEADTGTREIGRPSNDPRLSPKPVGEAQIASVVVDVKMSRPLDTSQQANITRQPRNITRPANDPRAKRAASAGAADRELDEVSDSGVNQN